MILLPEPVWNMDLGKSHGMSGMEVMEELWKDNLMTAEEYLEIKESIGDFSAMEQEVMESSGLPLVTLFRGYVSGDGYIGNQSLKNGRLIGASVIQMMEEGLSLEQISIKLSRAWGKTRLSYYKSLTEFTREFPLVMRLNVAASTIIRNLLALRKYCKNPAAKFKWGNINWEHPKQKVNVKIDKELFEFELPVRSTIADLKKMMKEEHPTIEPRLQWGKDDMDDDQSLDGIAASEFLTQFVGLPAGAGEEEKSFPPPEKSWRESHCGRCWLQYFHGFNPNYYPPCHCTNFEVVRRSIWKWTDNELDGEFAVDIEETEARYYGYVEEEEEDEEVAELEEKFAVDLAEMEALYYEKYCPELDCAEELPCRLHGFANLEVGALVFSLLILSF
jgi:hypothetical protein